MPPVLRIGGVILSSYMFIIESDDLFYQFHIGPAGISLTIQMFMEVVCLVLCEARLILFCVVIVALSVQPFHPLRIKFIHVGIAAVVKDIVVSLVLKSDKLEPRVIPLCCAINVYMSVFNSPAVRK